MPPIRTGNMPEVIELSSDDDNDTLVTTTSSDSFKSTPVFAPDSPLTDLDMESDTQSSLSRQFSQSSHSLSDSHSISRDGSSASKRVSQQSLSTKKSLGRDTQSRAAPVTICGHVLQPTVVFDTFWRWCAERKSIDDRRRTGRPPPWTEDPILQQYPFTNPFRVIDKVSQYLIREVIEKGSQDPTELVFRVLLFNTFTKPATWELLNEHLGPLTWKKYNRARYIEVLGNAKDDGVTLYTGSFQKTGPRWEKELHVDHLQLLEVFMCNNLPGKLQTCGSMAEAYAFIASFPSMGNFTSYQLLLNLSYTSVLNFSGNDFVVPGVGASSGLVKMFGNSLTCIPEDRRREVEVGVIRWMTETQNYHFKRLGLKFSGLGSQKLPMDLADLEHSICEVDKYARKAHPSIKGGSNRTEMKSKWKPSGDPYQAVPILPKAWSHPDRKVVRPCNEIPKYNKRYAVDFIAEDAETEQGVMCRVRWSGYKPNHDTWEPVDNLAQDAPEALNDYWKRRYGKRYRKTGQRVLK